ncbi:MAG: DUF1016 N-terminal domain-containing protein [Rhodopirellula sp. JB055]|uniref:DUF1016 N-terminal domain-containing protein n=1 Tax=Rhodopirellula sp. JB055 TaxID=3342846 RepID=UPI00370C0ABB
MRQRIAHAGGLSRSSPLRNGSSVPATRHRQEANRHGEETCDEEKSQRGRQMSELTSDKGYRDWIVSIKSQIHGSQIKAAAAVNYAMLELYSFLGEQIIERQETAKWGDGFLQQMSKDLSSEFPEIKGVSCRNLRSIRQWVSFWNQPDSIGKQAVSKSDPNWKQVVAKLAPDAKQLVSQIP